MQWKSNARYNQPVESGTIFTLKSDAHVVIHKFHGCGEEWFLSCNPLGLEHERLNTEDFSEAVEKAKSIVRKKLNQLLDDYAVFASDYSMTEITRY